MKIKAVVICLMLISGLHAQHNSYESEKQEHESYYESLTKKPKKMGKGAIIGGAVGGTVCVAAGVFL